MEIFSLFIDTAAIFCIIFGIYILRFDLKSKLYRIFFVLCVLISLTAFSTGRLYTSGNIESWFFWDEAGIIIIAICWAVNLHFCILLTDRKLKKLQALIIYLPAAAIIIVEFTPYRIVSEYLKINSLWKPIYAKTYFIYMTYSITYAVIAFVLVYRWGIRVPYKKKKLQIKTILYITIPLFFICTLADFLLPYFEFYELPAIGGFGLILYPSVVWYSFVKYRFLAPRSSLLLREIVLNIRETIILLDPELKIIKYNNKLNELINSNGNDHTGREIFAVVGKNDEIEKKINRIKNGELDYCYCMLNYLTGPGYITANTYITRIADKFGDLTGILLVSVENKGIREFRKIHRITDRQMEIINLCLSGYSNIEISEKLALALRTVETHFGNIYNKLKINNRMELFNIAKDYNIISYKTDI